jgi:hypothetical protein
MTEACPMPSASNESLTAREATPTPSEIVAPDSTRGIYEEALAELTLSERDEAKKVIASRIKEVQRLRVTLAKAENELSKLLQKSPAEIALMRF